MAAGSTQGTHIADNKAGDNGRFRANLCGDRLGGRVNNMELCERSPVEGYTFEGICLLGVVSIGL